MTTELKKWMRQIVLDCDTGDDDACAITLAAASPGLELLGVTTVMGNFPLEATYRNAREVIGYLGSSARVLKGCSDPLIRERWVGNDDSFPLAVPGDERPLAPEEPLGALDWLVKTLEEAEEPVTLVPLAPLTNIAKLMLFWPDLVEEKVAEIVIMGGGYRFGNTTGAAELNIYADPEAAQRVFSFGKPVVMCGLDVCHAAYITREENDKLACIPGKAAALYTSLVNGAFAWKKQHPEYYPDEHSRNSCIMYDTVPVVYLLHPEIFTTAKAHISVECSGDTCDGMTVITTRPPRNGGGDNRIHTVVLDVDRPKYIAALEDILRSSKM